MSDSQQGYTAFAGHHLLAKGSLAELAIAVKHSMTTQPTLTPLIFEDASGQQIDVDLRGSDEQIRARLAPLAHDTGSTAKSESTPEAPATAQGARGRGRPKLGVVAREVTLLPRHWEWLGKQPGGASVALRKLVEQARHQNEEREDQRQRHEAAYRFMSAVAGNFPAFEEATRALFANDAVSFADLVSSWPQDVRNYAVDLAFSDAATLPASANSPENGRH